MFASFRRAAAAIGVSAALLVSPAAAQDFFTIGTGGVTGVYYPTGGAICRLVNQDGDDHALRCSVQATAGSVYNIEAIRSGELAFGIAQSDVQYDAFKGTGSFEAQGPFETLRSVFALHPEPFIVVARADSGVTTFDDLKGKRVNLGNPGSGQRSTMDVVMEAKGWTAADFAQTTELKAGEQAKALCDGQLDAVIYVLGNPAGAIQEATTACDSVIVDVTGPEIDKLVAEIPFYRKAIIPGGMYRGNDSDVQTFGVGATFVTAAGVPEDTVYHLVRAVFENFDAFRAMHPALARLDKAQMVSQSLTAPLHPGAERYYREAGLIP